MKSISKNILKNEKKIKIKHGEFILNQLFAGVFHQVIAEIKSGTDINEIFENEWFKELYKFYSNELEQQINPFIMIFDPESIKVSKSFKNDVPLLIKGYRYYLDHIIGNLSERKLCHYIEQSIINKVLNVRQEFYNYNFYFKEMELKIGTPIDKQFKIDYLTCCSAPFLNN